MQQPGPLDILKRKIAAARLSKPKQAMARVDSCCHLIGGVMVGIGSGYYLDKFFSSKPLFFIICLFLGFVAGIFNIYRSL